MPLSEFQLIRDLFAPLATSKAALGLTDDVALLAPRAGHELVLTTDTIVAGVDFFATDPPGAIARKALRVNLSDLAAKGAAPFGYLLTLCLPKAVDGKWLRGFARGLAADHKTFGVSLLGGDLSSTPGPLGITVAALGYVPNGKAILRRGAQEGDLVFVSGTIGDSGAGLEALQAKRRAAFLIGRYRVPQPRLALGQKLRGLASAALDVSDGLLADLGHLADVSKVHVAIDATRVPLSPALRKFWGTGEKAVLRAATAGDDYEIAFCAPRARRAKVFAAAKAAGVPVTQIGWVMKGRGVALLGADGRPMPFGAGGWRHR
ncbi:MAG TPA: thiamine-phosphate kinase [Rhizomicrobium sp.]|jgi:thiamine-monophosphate kinase|nr:thiamine-phosphate kinase [Rhizomicrobium sp.]